MWDTIAKVVGGAATGFLSGVSQASSGSGASAGSAMSSLSYDKYYMPTGKQAQQHAVSGGPRATDSFRTQTGYRYNTLIQSMLRQLDNG